MSLDSEIWLELGAIRERVQAVKESTSERLDDLEEENRKRREWKRGPALLATLMTFEFIGTVIIDIIKP